MERPKHAMFCNIVLFYIFILLFEIIDGTQADGCGIEGLSTLGGKKSIIFPSKYLIKFTLIFRNYTSSKKVYESVFHFE